jgi:hypothetical protein
MAESLYDAANSRREKLNGLGYNYKGNIFRRTISSYIFVNSTRASILEKFETLVYFLLENVKTIKTYYNYTVPKNYRKIN